MKKIILTTLIAAGSLAVSQATLVPNGSFEDATLTGGSGGGTWNLFYNGVNPLSDWTSADPSIPLEVGLGSVYGVSGYDGANVMELDSTANVAVNSALVTAGGTYQLSFLYALRAGVDPASGTMAVVWDGHTVNLAPTSSAMTLYTASVTATGSDTLQFDGTGISDSYGAILDKVSLTAVPEPTTVAAGVLMLLPFGASTLRILRKNRVA